MSAAKKILAYIILTPLFILLIPVFLFAILWECAERLGKLHAWAMKEVGWK